jgi:uncharacterized protein (TIGR00661 family)
VLVLASGQAYPYLAQRLPRVQAIPGLFIAYARNRVRVATTITGNLRILRHKNRLAAELAAQLRPFRPELVIVDFEPFLPMAARRLGIAFISLDHQHVIPHLRLRVPPRLWFEYWSARAVIRLTHTGERANLVTSFFHPDPPHPPGVHFLPPILREEVRAHPPANRGHVVVSQTSASFARLPGVLARLPFPFRIYAFDRSGAEGNLEFKPRAGDSFLEDVAGADWVLTNGGYTLMSEALFYGKPVLSVPIAGQFEQWINGHFLEKPGYGMTCRNDEFKEGRLREFIGRRETFRRNLQGRDFFGNDRVVETILDHLPRGGRTPAAPGKAEPVLDS